MPASRPTRLVSRYLSAVEGVHGCSDPFVMPRVCFFATGAGMPLYGVWKRRSGGREAARQEWGEPGRGQRTTPAARTFRQTARSRWWSFIVTAMKCHASAQQLAIYLPAQCQLRFKNIIGVRVKSMSSRSLGR